MFFRELLMARVAPHLAHRVMEFLVVARETGLDLGTQTGELARLVQVRVEQLDRLGGNLGGQPAASLFISGLPTSFPDSLHHLPADTWHKTEPATVLGTAGESCTAFG